MSSKQLVLKPGQIVVLREQDIAIRVVRLIGEGGFSEVYEAIDVRTNAKYAIKVLQRRHADNAKTAERHAREGRALLDFRHKNIVRVYGMDVLESGETFLVMDLLVGWTLRELQQACHGRLPLAWALEIMVRVCWALALIHENAVHRDLKPENVHVSFDGKAVRLFDLGVARAVRGPAITTPGMALGTFAYMSPEALMTPEKVDFHADLFAIGVMLYELISGVHPFAVNGELSDDQRSTAGKIIFQPHTRLIAANPTVNVPPYVSAIVDRFLQKEPAHRPRSAIEAANALIAAGARLADEQGEDPLTNVADVSRRLTAPGSDPLEGAPLTSNPFASALPPEPAPPAVASSRSESSPTGTQEMPAIAEARRPPSPSATEELPAMGDGDACQSDAATGARRTMPLVQPATGARPTMPFVKPATAPRAASRPVAQYVTDERGIVLPPAPASRSAPAPRAVPVARVVVTAPRPKATPPAPSSRATWTPVTTLAAPGKLPAGIGRDVVKLGALVVVTCAVLWPLANAVVTWVRRPPAVAAKSEPMRVPVPSTVEVAAPSAPTAVAPVTSPPVVSTAVAAPLPPIPTAAPSRVAVPPPRRLPAKPKPVDPWL